MSQFTKSSDEIYSSPPTEQPVAPESEQDPIEGEIWRFFFAPERTHSAFDRKAEGGFTSQ